MSRCASEQLSEWVPVDVKDTFFAGFGGGLLLEESVVIGKTTVWEGASILQYSMASSSSESNGLYSLADTPALCRNIAGGGGGDDGMVDM